MSLPVWGAQKDAPHIGLCTALQPASRIACMQDRRMPGPLEHVLTRLVPPGEGRPGRCEVDLARWPCPSLWAALWALCCLLRGSACGGSS